MDIRDIFKKKDTEGKMHDTPTEEGVVESAEKTKILKKNSTPPRLGKKKRANRKPHIIRSFHKPKTVASKERVHIYDIVRKPVITEKSAQGSERGMYAFYVQNQANKHTVADAIETLYGVRPAKVRIAKRPAKKKRIRVAGREREHTLVGKAKKAYVFLKDGDTIQLT